ncbi:MAG: helix-turn-helix domain-containing protein [Bacteroidia bacterium]|nr:helix-turn-helix domain-containing protein [Bacteroidia bacterium]
MIKTQKNETWKKVKFKKGIITRSNYAVSNFGRFCRYEKAVEDGSLLNGSNLGGYKAISLRTGETTQTLYIHKLVAENFILKKSPKQKLVIHLDHDKTNNKQSNLQWANYSDVGRNQAKNPAFIARITKKPSYSKLTSAKVRNIKTMLDKGQAAKLIAEKFDVSRVQIYRIKNGEVWNHV